MGMWLGDIIQIKSIGHYIGKFFYIYINVNYTKHLSTSIYLRHLYKKTKIGTFEAFILMKLKEIKAKCNYYTLFYVHINTWITGITALRPIKGPMANKSCFLLVVWTLHVESLHLCQLGFLRCCCTFVQKCYITVESFLR